MKVLVDFLMVVTAVCVLGPGNASTSWAFEASAGNSPLVRNDPTRSEVYMPVVLTFTGEKHDNPYLEVVVYAVFRGPGNRILKVYAYWDGGNIWRIRFTPTVAGLWSYTLHTGHDSRLDGSAGQIEAVDSGGKGFIERDPEHPYAFKRSTGEPVFLMGDTLWNGMSTCGGALDFETYKEYINKRAAQQFNFMRIYICPFYANQQTPQHSNEGGKAFVAWDPAHLNPGYFRFVDRRIEYANAHGITVHLLFGSDKRNLTDFFGWNNGKLEAYVRYCCARFGAYDIAWEGRAEFEEQSRKTAVQPDAVTLANHLARWVSWYDPYDHLESIHTADSNNELAAESWLDWIMHQSRDCNLVVMDRAYGKPVMNEEFYYENSGAGATHSHHVDAELVRKTAWKLMTAGASGFAFGNTGTYNSRTQPFRGLRFADSPGARYMTLLNEFWRHTDYSNLAPPVGDKTMDWVANPGKEYVAYFEGGSTRRLYIHQGQYRFSWFNTRTGSSISSEELLVSTGESIPVKAPKGDDWVLHIVSIGVDRNL